MAPAPIMLASFLTGVFYAIDALYGERRDRSLLFWKSMPVSDLVTVLSKASVPVLVLPAIALGLSVATLHVLVLVATLVLIGSGVGAGALWSNLRFVQEQAIMVYGLAVHSLWFAPLYAWLLLVSAWARRAPLAWAVLPFVAIGAFERIALGSSGVGALLQYRVTGAMTEAFTADFGHEVVTPISQLTPLRFLSAPGLWLGLLFAGACLAAAVRLRRNREPA
jgi:ABC-2 type transport system permease protein